MRALIALLLLAACDSPSPSMTGAERVEVLRDGRSFVVYHTDKRVEVIRMGYAKTGEHQAIRAQMFDIIPEITGCRLIPTSVEGDSGAMRGRISCPKR